MASKANNICIDLSLNLLFVSYLYLGKLISFSEAVVSSFVK